ncbi:MAG: NUDIX domain-containing protein [Candidatus Paceibacterota bacterium]
MQLFLVCEGKLLLILRDNKPDIKDDPINGIHFPNTWALMGGGVEEGEDFFQTAARELLEELGIEFQLQILGVSAKGNCYFFAEIGQGLADKIVLGEGQEYRFFNLYELDSLELGGAIKIYLAKYRDIIMKMIVSGKPAQGSQMGLFIWNGGQPNKVV